MSLSLTKRDDGPNWWITGYVGGRRFRRSSGTASKSQAEQIKAKLEAELFQREVYGDKSVATFAEAAKGYLKSGGSDEYLEPLILKIGAKKLAEIDQEFVDDLALEMKPRAKPSTRIRQIYTPIIAIVTDAATKRKCDPIKIKKPDIDAEETPWLTVKQAQDWLDALERRKDLQRLVTFLLGTGARITEAIELKWTHVPTGEDRFVFWKTKGGYARSGDIPERVRKALPKRPADEDQVQVIFQHSRGDAWGSYRAVDRRLKLIQEARERDRKKDKTLPPLVKVHCHMFRHTWATWAYACTRDLAYLMGKGGWRSPSMVMRYSHLGSDGLAREILGAGWSFGGREIALKDAA